jgi:hypothetical protein
VPLVGGLCLAQQTSTTNGLKKLPLVGGLCLAQQNLITEGLKKLPLVGGLCLAQQTLTSVLGNSDGSVATTAAVAWAANRWQWQQWWQQWRWRWH